ncbi:MAG: glycosyltransferase [Enterobacter sp.]|nr:glycosyltransferase [Enterobacter sp.]
MSVIFRPCVLIPCYNHGAMIASVLSRLAPFGLPCLVVDDGSDAVTRRELERLAAEQPQMTLVRLAQNAGKGAAVIRGLEECARTGYTHAVQVDADGQHAIEDIPKLAAREPLGKRMDFDTEVMVRLYWQGNTSVFLPTRVTYPQDGLSHFDALKDNVRISLMHTRLFFGMLPRMPGLLFRRRRQHWAQQDEVKGLWGMRLMLRVWELLGRRAFTVLLWPVIGVYWLIARPARQASRQWMARVKQELRQRSMPVPSRLNSFFHFMRFGNAMLDKVASWRGELKLHRDIVFAHGASEALNIAAPQGKLLLASHLGDVEACRALAQLEGSKIINALVFSENAQRFKQIMSEMAPEAGVNLMSVTDIGPDTAIAIKEKLERGEWVAIVGDRIAVNPQRGGEWRVIWSRFMGQPAPFPQGPFILASILRCPVVLIFALRQQGKLVLHCEPFADPLRLPRGERQQALQDTVDRYAQRLEHYALMSPLDWFNFFDFWHLPESSEKE